MASYRRSLARQRSIAVLRGLKAQLMRTKSDFISGSSKLVDPQRTPFVKWPEVCLLLSGVFGFGLAQVVAFAQTDANAQSNSFSQTAYYHVFAAVLGMEFFFYAAMMPIAWFTFGATRKAIGKHYRHKRTLLSLFGIALITLSLPFVVPSLPEVAVFQTRRTDLATLLAFLTVVAPSLLGIIAIRLYAQEGPVTRNIDELVNTVGRVRQHLRFYLISLAITIVLGVFVLASIRLAVAHYISAHPYQHVDNIQSVFPIEFVVLYGAAFSLILACVYGPAEGYLTTYARREYTRLLPIDWSEGLHAEQSLELRREIETQLEMSAGQRFERWLAILAPLITGVLAALGKA